MNTDKTDQDELTGQILGCAFKVSNTLGTGFLEKVYENALAVELKKSGLEISQQKTLSVFYEGIIVGEYVADLIVEHRIIVELKAAKAIDKIHQAQLMNYLKATELNVGLILNFGTPKLGVKRIVF